MRFSMRSIIASFLSYIALIGTIGTLVMGTLIGTPRAYAASRSSGSYNATKGKVAIATTVNLSQLLTGKVPPASKPKLIIPYHSPSQVISNRTLQMPLAAGVPLSGIGSLVENFDGLKSLDNKKVNGFELEPPDQGLCVGNDFVVELINIVGAVYRPDGSIVKGPFGLQAFFGETPGQSGTFISDPRCYFDATTNTWFATVLAEGNQFPPTTHVDLAVNTSGDPTKSWTIYRVDTTDVGAPGCPCLPDQPIIGIDSYNLYITENEFSLLSPTFNGAQIYVLSKSQLVSLSHKVNIVHFGNLTTGGFPTYHLEPAITDGSAKAEYLMNSLGIFDNLDNRLELWAITNRQAVTSGSIPTLSSTIVTVETYVAPSVAPNPNGNLLSPDDDGLLQLQYINGNLWTSLNTALFVAGDGASRDGAAWFEVHPELSSDGSKISDGTIVRQGYTALKGNYLLYSAIAVSSDGTAVMVFTVTGTNTFPSAAYAILREGASSFGAVRIAAKGTTTDNGFSCGGNEIPCRWGDYSAAVIDPSIGDIWVGTEYIPPIGATMANWGTRLFEVGA